MDPRLPLRSPLSVGVLRRLPHLSCRHIDALRRQSCIGSRRHLRERGFKLPRITSRIEERARGRGDACAQGFEPVAVAHGRAGVREAAGKSCDFVHVCAHAYSSPVSSQADMSPSGNAPKAPCAISDSSAATFPVQSRQSHVYARASMRAPRVQSFEGAGAEPSPEMTRPPQSAGAG